MQELSQFSHLGRAWRAEKPWESPETRLISARVCAFKILGIGDRNPQSTPVFGIKP